MKLFPACVAATKTDKMNAACNDRWNIRRRPAMSRDGSQAAMVKDMHLFKRSLISGFLSYISVSLPHFLADWYAVSDDLLFLFPGLLFGIFILLPLARPFAHRGIRRAALIMGSVAAWYVAVSIGIQVLPAAAQSPVLSCGFSGCIGVAILAATSRAIISVPLDLVSALNALLAAFLGGCVIGLAVAQPRASLVGESLYLIGFVFWQTSVAFFLFRKAEASRKTGDAK